MSSIFPLSISRTSSTLSRVLTFSNLSSPKSKAGKPREPKEIPAQVEHVHPQPPAAEACDSEFESTQRPKLPAELWIKIIAAALEPAITLSPERECPFSHPDYNAEEARQCVQLATSQMANLLSFERVCRTWRYVAYEAASRHLVLRTCGDVVVATRKLQRLDAVGVPWGARTLRLDFVLREYDPGCAAHISLLFQQTPNLQIYVNENYVGAEPPISEKMMAAPVIDALVEHCGHSLRRVEWVGDKESPALATLVTLAYGAPNLQTLHVRCIHSYYGADAIMDESTAIHFPNLQTLSLGLIPSESRTLRYDGHTSAPRPNRPPNWDLFLACLCASDGDQLARLRRFEIDLFPPPFFLLKHGRKLTHLRITADAFQILTLSEVLWSAVPNQETLVLTWNVGTEYITNYLAHLADDDDGDDGEDGGEQAASSGISSTSPPLQLSGGPYSLPPRATREGSACVLPPSLKRICIAPTLTTYVSIPEDLYEEAVIAPLDALLCDLLSAIGLANAPSPPMDSDSDSDSGSNRENKGEGEDDDDKGEGERAADGKPDTARPARRSNSKSKSSFYTFPISIPPCENHGHCRYMDLPKGHRICILSLREIWIRDIGIFADLMTKAEPRWLVGWKSLFVTATRGARCIDG